MASQLKVDTITGVTTAGSIAVTGEGNSTTTNLQSGLAKAWVNYNHHTGPTVRKSFNVSSMTDTATGKFQANWTNSFNDYLYCSTSNHGDDNEAYGNYGAGSRISWHNGHSVESQYQQRPTTHAQGSTTVDASGGFADMRTIEGMFLGDLA
jgi:hypothetical protein